MIDLAGTRDQAREGGTFLHETMLIIRLPEVRWETEASRRIIVSSTQSPLRATTRRSEDLPSSSRDHGRVRVWRSFGGQARACASRPFITSSAVADKSGIPIITPQPADLVSRGVSDRLGYLVPPR